ncbi:MAG TPA: ATP synthase F1 subunit gamma [Solirubrobacteraceae bacterium]|nr:ATP synthase F1 subunit gamma [Solirubrobacteraceae bacterium]
MASQRDVKNKIASVRNIQKITRAMEMVAAARLRRAEQRIAVLRPYADAIRRMTRQAAQAAGAAETARMPLLAEHDSEQRAALLLVTGDRGLAGAFNSQIIRAGIRLAGELASDSVDSVWYATGRRGASSLAFRGYDLQGSYTGFTDKPAYADARAIAADLTSAYSEGRIDRVDMLYNAYVSPLTQTVTHERLLPLSRATIGGEQEDDGAEPAAPAGRRALVEYEPEPEKILATLVPDYVETSIFRALVESAAGFFGAQMTAMRSASENAGEIITDYTLQMNRARQAEITQEIMEVVAGAEGLS